MAVKVNKHDLQFILGQIKIAEAHADGTPLSELVESPLLPYGLRTVDGSYNNIVAGREQWGASDEVFPGLMEPTYPVGSGTLGGPAYPTNNDYGEEGDVVDGEPRLISNLIVDQTPDNPAAIMAALHHAEFNGDSDDFREAVATIQTGYNQLKQTIKAHEDGILTDVQLVQEREDYANALAEFGIEIDGETLVLPNVAPDDGISASFNAFFTFFGQFFDHGLDLVAKGGNGTVYMPLSPDDPLYVEGGHTNFMVMTRATTGEEARNITTPWVDQNQTYTSNASHQVFLREYTVNEEGEPLSTGRLLNGDRGLATWGDVKKQAEEKLGIKLTDMDVTAVPELLVDPYGEFIRGDNGLPQILAAFDPAGNPIYVEGDLNDPIAPSAIQLPPGTQIMGSNGSSITIQDGTLVSAARTGHAFLDDIAHNAVPGQYDSNGNHRIDPDDNYKVADDDDVAGDVHAPQPVGTYDNELLDAHYITGDGRGNENIGLTAVHHVFHSEHNRQVEDMKGEILKAAETDIAFLNEWLLEDVEAGFDPNALQWDGERLFQSARFVTEMEYQHLVFEEFVRKIQPDVDIFMVQPDAEMSPDIFAEFAHVIYRFGHSMLNETVETVDANGVRTSIDLFDAFLNPLAFGAEDEDGNVTVSHDKAAGAIIRGMTSQVGNEIDEFVTNTLRNQLLGIPLDLPAINIARGRDTGVPTLNEARAQFMEMADGDTQLKPYENWSDFALNLKNPASIINFLAAYGTHELIAAEDTIQGKRAAAMSIVFDSTEQVVDPGPTGQIWSGTGSNHDPADENPLVDDAWYNATYPDVAAAGVDPDAHYANHGVNEGRNPNEFFDTDWYRDTYGINGNPLEHYANQGWLQGNNPSLDFDGERYLQENPDVVEAGMNPLFHFLSYGRHEGREYYAVETGPRAIESPDDRMDFLNGTGAYANDPELGGLQNIDLWIGGLAEKKMSFGGMLGSTFAFVFEMQMESLQDADRFYYLSRVQGLNLLTELENNSLAKMALANTDLGETDFPIPADQFAAADHVLYMDYAKQLAMTGLEDPVHDDPTLGHFTSMVERRDEDGDGIAEYIRYNGADHVVIQGTDGDDHIVAGDGDDTVWGGDGDDRIEAGYGVDLINGGEGDDIITNSGTDIGEVDMLKGDGGNDVIHGGSGMALIFGGDGKDFLMTGPDGSEIRGGQGDDFIMGGDGQDILFGNEGDDWIEGKGRFEYIAGDNGELFFNSTVIGHDVLNGGQGDTDYDADSGDDIMVAGEGIQKFIGMWGHDWVIHKGQEVGANADMNFPMFPNLPMEVLRDRFSQVEAVSGWKHDDVLRGDDRVYDDSFELETEIEEEGPEDEDFDGDDADNDNPDEQGTNAPGFTIVEVKQEQGPNVYDPTPEGNFVHNELDREGIARIDGLDRIITDDMLRREEYWAEGPERPSEPWEVGSIVPVKDVFVGGNILLGGGGSDILEGRGGDDVLDGDAWLNVRISIRNENGDEIGTAEGMDTQVHGPTGELLHGGRPLTALMLDRTFNPGQLYIVREILYDASGIDRALYWDDQENYAFDGTSDGRLVVEHVTVSETDGEDGNEGNPFDPITGKNRTSDGRDILANIEELEFRNGVVNVTNGTNDDEVLDGTGGNDILLGMDGNDTLNGGQGADVLIGGRGDDTLNGNSGSDRLIGGVGNDVLNGGTGNDIYVFGLSDGIDSINEVSGGGAEDRILIKTGGAALDSLTAHDSHGARDEGSLVIGYNDSQITVEGHYNGTNAQTGVEFINFDGGSIGGYEFGQGDYRISKHDPSDDRRSGTTENDFIAGENGGTRLSGGAGNDILLGGDGDDEIRGGIGEDLVIGGRGDDQLFGGGGDDTFLWSVGDGRDVISGGAGHDTVHITGNGDGEHYYIYTRNDWLELDGNNGSQLDGGTEIVITRNGTDNTAVIAELQNVEEIVINGMGGGDTFTTSGNFDDSSLSHSTITLEGSEGDETVDISGLLSAHRIYFRSNGGNDTILGTLRPQDVIELPKGAKAANYTLIENEDGTSTFTNGDHAVTFTSSDGTPHLEDGEDDQPPAPSDPGDEVDDTDPVEEGGDGQDDIADNDDQTTPTYGVGTAAADLLIGTDGNDTLLGLDGDDNILAGAGDDVILGGAGNDFLSGEDGRDVIFAGDGNDVVFGGAGADMIYGDGGNDRIFGGSGDDLINGGSGNDTIFGGAGDDTFVAEACDGNDTYYGDDLDGGTGIDTLDMSSIMANITADLGTGAGGRGWVTSAETGNDVLYDVENIITGSGDDVITASRAVNVMDGGAGDDTFRFLSAADADGDTIMGFQPGDRIDISGIDANGCASGHQGFTLVTEAFTSVGQLMFSHQTLDGEDYTVVQGNTTEDDGADFTINIKGRHELTESDFNL